MKMQRLIATFLFAALALFVIRAVAQQSAPGPQSTTPPDMMTQQQQMMRGMGPGMMGTGQDSGTMAEMGIIHEMVVNHERIKRTVTNLSDGIRTVTESDDPQIAQLIKQHVASMDRRVSAKSDPGLPMESPALKTILRNGDKVRSTVEITSKGVVVVQRSADPETVAALQEHASELSDLVKRGMVAMHESMMQSGGAMQNHDQHLADVNKRGDEVMGFDHDKTTHHFRLFRDGGAIEVQANDPKDTSSRDQVRQHLKHIAQIFAAGDFTSPMLIHAQTPPGVPVMKRLKAQIQYKFEQTARGGRVRITSKNSEAIAATHEFLRFQIKDHGTKDSGEIEKP